MKGGRNLIFAAFALTALSYGLARFAYGLLLPEIRDELSLSTAAAGWIGGAAFAAYCIGISVASLASMKLGDRTMAILAGLAATAGAGLVALAPSAPVLGVAMGLSGLSTGLTSPPLASIVARQFNRQDRPKVNGMINAGTAAGIVLSGIAAMSLAAAWRELYVIFALIGVAVTAWLWFALPAGTAGHRLHRLPAGRHLRTALANLCAAAFLVGASSTAIWTFGADLLRTELRFSEECIAIAWIALGLGGLAGFMTGSLVMRFGIVRVHRMALLGIALCYGMILGATLTPLLAFTAMAIFGASYIVSSGVLLIRGVALLPDQPDLGLGIPFLAFALGQTVGAPLFGALMGSTSAWAALSIFVAITCTAMVWRMEDVATSQAKNANNPICKLSG